MERKIFLSRICAIAAGSTLPFTDLVGQVSKTLPLVDKTLRECTARFGIPNTSGGEQWKGENILLCDVKIHLKDKSYKASSEHRNQPIGAGHAIYMVMPFTESDKKNISFEDVYQVEVILKARHGSGGSGQDYTRFRVEGVLQFNDGRIISTGYNQPADRLTTGGGSYTWEKRREFFEYEIRLNEPIY